ncbi:MAG TPA: N-acetylmuramic acid 6-phosphate etherase [Cryomorphaceae bacterium]|nr:N-acetylmuramic acid 6-phosphate etherase [Cryomorphaceae bacterium]
MKKHTEKESHYDDLEKKDIGTILAEINQEDAKVHQAIRKSIPQIEQFVTEASERMKKGGRLFYIGAGTSGRLGIVDASECPPTFGVPHGLVIGIIAGGDTAIRKAVEFAEDSTDSGWKDLAEHKIGELDALVGIAASGTTPYVIGAIKQARLNGVLTGAITCNEGSPLAEAAEYPMEIITGPEYVTGSTRMKAGSAQKLVLNMISTSLMIQLGRVKGNRMVDMQLSNNKLVDRGTRMVMEMLGVGYREANELLLKHGSVRGAIKSRED